MIARDALSVLTDSHSVTHSHPVTRAGGGARRGVFTFLPCKILVIVLISGESIFYLKGVFSPNTPFFYERARLAPYELTHHPPPDCAAPAGWAQAWRKI